MMYKNKLTYWQKIVGAITDINYYGAAIDTFLTMLVLVFAILVYAGYSSSIEISYTDTTIIYGIFILILFKIKTIRFNNGLISAGLIVSWIFLLLMFITNNYQLISISIQFIAISWTITLITLLYKYIYNVETKEAWTDIKNGKK